MRCLLHDGFKFYIIAAKDDTPICNQNYAVVLWNQRKGRYHVICAESS